MALVQILLHLQADAPHFRQPQQQLAELVRVSWVSVLGVLHQGPVHPLLGVLHLPATLHRLHICTEPRTRNTPSSSAAARKIQCWHVVAGLTWIEQHQVFETNKLLSVQLERFQFGHQVLRPRHQAAECDSCLGNDG